MKKLAVIIFSFLVTLPILGASSTKQNLNRRFRPCKVYELPNHHYYIATKDGRSALYHGQNVVIPISDWDSIDVHREIGWYQGNQYFYQHYGTYLRVLWKDGLQSAYTKGERRVPAAQWDSIHPTKPVAWRNHYTYLFKENPQSESDVILCMPCDSVKRVTEVLVYPCQRDYERRYLKKNCQNLVEEYFTLYKGDQVALYNVGTQSIVVDYGEWGEFFIEPVDASYSHYDDGYGGEFKTFYIVKQTPDPKVRSVLYTSQGRKVMNGYDEYRFYNKNGYWDSGDFYNSKKYYGEYNYARGFINQYIFCIQELTKYIAVRNRSDKVSVYAYCDTLGNVVFPAGEYKYLDDAHQCYIQQDTLSSGVNTCSLYTVDGHRILQGVPEDDKWSYNYDKVLNYVFKSHVRIDTARANLYDDYLNHEIGTRLRQWIERRSYESEEEYAKRVNKETAIAKVDEMKNDFVSRRLAEWEKALGPIFKPHKSGNASQTVSVKVEYNKDREQFTFVCGDWGTFTCDVRESESPTFEKLWNAPGTMFTIVANVSRALKDITPYQVNITLSNNTKYVGYFVYNDPEVVRLLQLDALSYETQKKVESQPAKSAKQSTDIRSEFWNFLQSYSSAAYDDDDEDYWFW